MGFAVALENLDTDIGRSEGDTLGYHLHTMWSNSGNSETLAQCAGFFTGGHYDPTYRCGPASQASKTNQCKNADYANCSPSQPSACEFGDLSGKYGKLVIDGNHEAAISVTGDTQGAKPQHYVLSNGIAEALVVHSLS